MTHPWNADRISKLNVVALAGGVGGARLVDGLAQMLAPENLTVIVNTGDDFEHFGLKICPDIDTICYTLADLANPATGWGQAGESWQALETLARLGGPTWFRLGDRDLGLNLERTRRIHAGNSLSQVTHHFCQSLGVQVQVLPMSDDAIPTMIQTEEGELAFQEYFVRRKCQPKVTGFRFEGNEQARPAPGVLSALQQADLVVFCPSNPWVSIDPILAVPGIKTEILQHLSIAVSPIINGQTIKGPAAKMFSELGIQPSASAVAEHYQDLLSGFVLDRNDTDQIEAIKALGIAISATDTIMNTRRKRALLAKEVIAFGVSLLDEK